MEPDLLPPDVEDKIKLARTYFMDGADHTAACRLLDAAELMEVHAVRKDRQIADLLQQEGTE